VSVERRVGENTMAIEQLVRSEDSEDIVVCGS
jgi:hypothetical protein